MDSSAQELRASSLIVPIQDSTISEVAEDIWMMLVSAVLKVAHKEVSGLLME
jgi:hypothetical protein